MEKTPKKDKEAIKAEKKEILAAWKEEKKAKKQARKEARALRKARKKARPFWRKLICPCVTIAVVITLAVVLFAPAMNNLIMPALKPTIMDMYFYGGYKEPDLEFEREYIPADTQAQEAIQAMTGYDKDDTWAIYLYVIGSDLESAGQNDLSDMFQISIRQEVQENIAQSREEQLSGLDLFADAINAAGLELPSPLYHTNPPTATETTTVPVVNKVVVSDRTGAVTLDLSEIFAVELPENIDVVIRTGGAAHWTNPIINPNRVQTFLYNSDGLTEEINKPAYNLASVDALADFLEYCKDNHDADHKVLVLWDHGAGSFGYGHDEIFETEMSVKQIGEALAKVCKANPTKPEFELIGFDACLMASAEMLDALDGYGKYFAGSEELEPGCGWYYTEILNALKENPGMNGAQLGLVVADSYMDFYARVSNNIFTTIGLPVLEIDDITFSVLDLHKAAGVYDAYADLMEAALTLSVKDESVLTDISQAAKSAIHYGNFVSHIYNTLDIGTFMDNMPEALAKETQKVQDALNASVLYTRSSNSLKGSRGLSVYFPDATTDTTAISKMVSYVTTISNHDAMNALYFYKAAGCLTEDMQAALAEKGLAELKPLNLDALKAVAAIPVELGNLGGYSVQVSQEAQDRMTGIGLVIGKVDDENITYYGISADASLSDQGVLSTDFAGKWISLGGQPLSVEVVFNGAENMIYHAPIKLNGRDATLVFSCDKASGEYSILGAYEDSDAIDGDYIGRNISDLMVGSLITPVYKCENSENGSKSTLEGEAITWDGRAEIEQKPLPNGRYLTMITFGSIRGDEFNTGTVEMTIKNGKVTGQAINDEYTYVYGN